MRRALIVDDEVHAVRGLISSVGWEAAGIGDVRFAYNIRKAKEILSGGDIDLLISDIEMPQGDGLELLEWVRVHHPRTVSIFLTCHADFEYARRAIALGVMAYQLKPARAAELGSLIAEAVRKLDETDARERDLDTYRRYYELWSSNRPQLVERFWLDVLDRALSAEGIPAALSEIDADFSADAVFVPLLVSIHRPRVPGRGADDHVAEDRVRSDFKARFIFDSRKGAVLALRKGLLLAILPEEGRNLRRDAVAFIDEENREAACDLSCYIGTPVAVADVPDMVDRLLFLERNNINARNKVFAAEGGLPGAVAIEAPDLLGLGDHLLLGEADRFIEALRVSLSAAARSGGLSARLLDGYRRNAEQTALAALARKGLPASSCLPASLEPEAFHSADEFMAWVSELAHGVEAAVTEAERSQSAIGRMRAFIAERLDADVDRESIAEAFSITPDHLTRIFKKETGLSVSAYLIRARMEAAKEMLAGSSVPIGEIAVTFGYRNFSHFSKLFKRETGLTPLEFRAGKARMP